MTTVLIGDSHLARVRRDLAILGTRVRNAAVGGSSSLGLLEQAASARVGGEDVVVVSVGTNDAAPWKRVSLADFLHALSSCLRSVEAGGWVYVAPPGVVEARLTGHGDRTNAAVDQYRAAAIAAFREAGAHVVRADLLVGPLGASAFAADGVHLNGAGYRALLPAVASAISEVGSGTS